MGAPHPDPGVHREAQHAPHPQAKGREPPRNMLGCVCTAIHVHGGLARKLGRRGEREGGREERRKGEKPPLFAEDTMYIHVLRNLQKIPLGLISDFSKVTGYKISIQTPYMSILFDSVCLLESVRF